MTFLDAFLIAGIGTLIVLIELERLEKKMAKRVDMEAVLTKLEEDKQNMARGFADLGVQINELKEEIVRLNDEGDEVDDDLVERAEKLDAAFDALVPDAVSEEPTPDTGGGTEGGGEEG